MFHTGSFPVKGESFGLQHNTLHFFTLTILDGAHLEHTVKIKDHSR